jgi:aspartate aminotransferase
MPLSHQAPGLRPRQHPVATPRTLPQGRGAFWEDYVVAIESPIPMPRVAESSPVRHIARRAASLSESATLGLSQRVRELTEQGVDVIHLGSGQPDFPTPEHVISAASAACRDPANHRYSATAGLTGLRTTIARLATESTHVPVDPTQVVVTNGTKQALAHVFQALINPGDEVLLPQPAWVTYPDQISLAGGEAVPIMGAPENGFRVTRALLDAAVTKRTTMLVLNSPVNPTGTVYRESELREIGEWAQERDIWVAIDEIYSRLVYAPNVFHSLVEVVPQIETQCLTFDGVSKSFAMTGWRVGWVIAPRKIAHVISDLQSQVCGNVDNVAQRAAEAALLGPGDHLAVMLAEFDRRRHQLYDGLTHIPDVTCCEPQGAFYTFPDFRRRMLRPILGHHVKSTAELARILLEEARVAVLPGEAFGAPGFLRISFASSLDRLSEGLRRIGSALS